MRKPPTPRPKKAAIIALRTTPEIKVAADVAAQSERRSTSQWVEGLIVDALLKKEKK